MYNSMLSSPATHIVNGVSNFTAAVMRPAAAAAGGDIKAKKAACLLASTLSMRLSTMPWRWLAASGTLMTTMPREQSPAMVRHPSCWTIWRPVLRLLVMNAFQAGVSMMRTIDEIANFPLFNWPTRALTTADEFFKTAVQRMEYNRMMMEEAIDLNGNDVEAVFEHLLKKKKNLNFTKSGESLNKELNRLAKEITFQTRP